MRRWFSLFHKKRSFFSKEKCAKMLLCDFKNALCLDLCFTTGCLIVYSNHHKCLIFLIPKINNFSLNFRGKIEQIFCTKIQIFLFFSYLNFRAKSHDLNVEFLRQNSNLLNFQNRFLHIWIFAQNNHNLKIEFDFQIMSILARKFKYE